MYTSVPKISIPISKLETMNALICMFQNKIASTQQYLPSEKSLTWEGRTVFVTIFNTDNSSPFNRLSLYFSRTTSQGPTA